MMIDELRRVNKIDFTPVQEVDLRTIKDCAELSLTHNKIEPEVAIDWLRVLNDYVSKIDCTYFVRKMEHSGRRGFVTKGHLFRYVFCDNSLAKAIYALAMEGFCPHCADEFEECVQRFALPCLMKTDGDEVRNPACVFCHGSKPKLLGWKLAHILPINADYYDCDYDDFQCRYFTRGRVQDWRLDNNDGMWIRHLEVDAARLDANMFRAHFLRFLSPINQFLFPLRHLVREPGHGRDISECHELLDYIRGKRRSIFGQVFAKFEEDVLAVPFRPDENMVEKLGGTVVNVHANGYGNNVMPARLTRDTAHVRHMERVGTAGKVGARISGWAQKSSLAPNKILRAFFGAADDGLVASYREVRERCLNDRYGGMTERRFKAAWASLKTNAGNSYGRIFIQNGDAVRLVGEVRELILAHRDSFV